MDLDDENYDDDDDDDSDPTTRGEWHRQMMRLINNIDLDYGSDCYD